MSPINSKPPSGMRDFLPEELPFRRELFSTARQHFESYGYLPLETPAMERLELLVGPYAEEGERLIYRVLKPGDRTDGAGPELGLRYNFTVPLARVVVEHRGEISLPFRAYQMGPVWRADRPGQGRYRESYHCDVDLVGSASPTADAEVILLLAETLQGLGLHDLTVKLNSRRILSGIVEAYSLPPAQEAPITAALGKLRRAGKDATRSSLASLGVPAGSVEALVEELSGEGAEEHLRDRLASSPAGQAGLSEVEAIAGLVSPLLEEGRVLWDPLLARGLDYYTGPFFEILAPGQEAFVALGGRYDHLIGYIGGKELPACGGSLYMDRITLLLQDRDKQRAPSARVLVTVWDEGLRPESFGLAAHLRKEGIATELYPGEGKLGRQLRYAADRGIPYCIVLGPDESSRGEVVIKEMATGSQKSVPRDQVGEALSPEAS